MSLLIFCLLNLSISDREMLESPIVTVIHLFLLVILSDFASHFFFNLIFFPCGYIYKIYIFLSIVDLQCCVNFCCTE